MQEVINAAYSAFYASLHAALFLSAGLVFAAGLFTVLWFGSHHIADAARTPLRATAEPGPRHAKPRTRRGRDSLLPIRVCNS